MYDFVRRLNYQTPKFTFLNPQNNTTILTTKHVFASMKIMFVYKLTYESLWKIYKITVLIRYEIIYWNIYLYNSTLSSLQFFSKPNFKPLISHNVLHTNIFCVECILFNKRRKECFDSHKWIILAQWDFGSLTLDLRISSKLNVSTVYFLPDTTNFDSVLNYRSFMIE